MSDTASNESFAFSLTPSTDADPQQAPSLHEPLTTVQEDVETMCDAFAQSLNASVLHEHEMSAIQTSFVDVMKRLDFIGAATDHNQEFLTKNCPKDLMSLSQASDSLLGLFEKVDKLEAWMVKVDTETKQLEAELKAMSGPTGTVKTLDKVTKSIDKTFAQFSNFLKQKEPKETVVAETVSKGPDPFAKFDGGAHMQRVDRLFREFETM